MAKRPGKKESYDLCPVCGSYRGDKDDAIESLRRTINTLLTRISLLEEELSGDPQQRMPI